MPSYHKPASSKFFCGTLYQKMADDLRLSGKAERTVHGYLNAPLQRLVRPHSADFSGDFHPASREIQQERRST
jgi:hypothetical protein